MTARLQYCISGTAVGDIGWPTRQNGRRWQRLFLGDEKEGARNPTKVLLETILYIITTGVCVRACVRPTTVPRFN